MKVGDLVEWRGYQHHAIDKAGRIGVVTDMMPQFPPSFRRMNRAYPPRRRVLFPAPAGEMVVRQGFLKVLS
jgi:hypothetical protein